MAQDPLQADAIQFSSDGYALFGPPNTEGSWRFKLDGSNLVFERYESGVWVAKETFIP